MLANSGEELHELHSLDIYCKDRNLYGNVNKIKIMVLYAIKHWTLLCKIILLDNVYNAKYLPFRLLYIRIKNNKRSYYCTYVHVIVKSRRKYKLPHMCITH